MATVSRVSALEYCIGDRAALASETTDNNVQSLLTNDSVYFVEQSELTFTPSEGIGVRLCAHRSQIVSHGNPPVCEYGSVTEQPPAVDADKCSFLE